MRAERQLLIVVLLLAFSACSSIEVTSDHDPKANFSAYHTYNWAPGPQQSTGDPRLDKTLLDSRIREAVERQLTAKGLTKDSGAKPDLLVAYHVAVRGKQGVTTVSDASWYQPGWGYRGGGGGGPTYASDYEEGTLILDLLNASNRQLVWRGSAQAEVKENISPDKRQERINEAVQKILERFPPKK